MERTVEPELMEDTEQAEAYAQADFAAAHRMYPELFAQKFPERASKARVLDLGCGPCDVTIRFAQVNPGYIFHAVDGSAPMLRFGDAAVRQAKLVRRIKLIKGIIPGARIPWADYDVILSSSFLHHLHEPQVLWRTVRQYAKRGTIVFVTDLRRPSSRLKARGMVKRYSGDAPQVLRRDFYNSLLAAFTPAEVRRQLRDARLPELNVEVVSDRHLLVFGEAE